MFFMHFLVQKQNDGNVQHEHTIILNIHQSKLQLFLCITILEFILWPTHKVYNIILLAHFRHMI